VLRRAVLSFTLLALGIAGAAVASIATPGASTRGAQTGTGPATTAPVRTPTVPGAAVAATEGTSRAPATLVIAGRGWGHGVGLGQWGMLGFAREGWPYARILAHYYRGTTIERRAPVTVGVLLVESAAKVTLSSTTAWEVVDGNGKKVELKPRELTLGVGLAVRGKRLASPLTFSPAREEPLAVRGKRYRGQLRVFSNRKRLQVVNAVGLEDYLKGVVPAEVPDEWPAEALKSQAVAARSYALAGLAATGPDPTRTFDLYADTRDQVYDGVEAESPPVTRAVQATARQVLVYGGRIVRAYYSSTTGGRTASASEWLGSPVPYLVSVEDPYDTLSPYHTWGPVLFDARKVAKALGLSGALVDLRATRGDSGRVRELTAVGTAGEVTVAGTDVRTLLGLRSTWFTVGLLSLSPPVRAAYGSVFELTGTARGVEGRVVLEGQTPGGAWQQVAVVRPRSDGTFSVKVRPKASTSYRLAVGDVSGALVSVPVEAVVEASVAARLLEGKLRPALAGTAVEVQREAGGAWATIATARTDPRGAFALARKLRPGSYRVRVAPGNGLEPGVSRALAVP
jgi:stage II sporulation protein D